MVQVVVIKDGRIRRFDPAVHGQGFLAKANVKPPAPIAQNKPQDVRVEGKQILHVSQTVPEKPRRIVHSTRLPHHRV